MTSTLQPQRSPSTRLAELEAQFNNSAKLIANVGDNADEYDLIDAALKAARDIAYAGGWNWGLGAADLDLLDRREEIAVNRKTEPRVDGSERYGATRVDGAKQARRLAL